MALGVAHLGGVSAGATGGFAIGMTYGLISAVVGALVGGFTGFKVVNVTSRWNIKINFLIINYHNLIKKLFQLLKKIPHYPTLRGGNCKKYFFIIQSFFAFH